MRKKGSSDGGGRSKFVRLMKLPIRALSRARDYYVRLMVDCGQVSRYPGAHGAGMGLGRSSSVVSSSATVVEDHGSEDFRELVRAASVRTLASGVRRRVLRSASVGVGIGMGRIDEEKVEEDFDDDETRKLRLHGGGRKQSVGFWRSQSHAATKHAAF